MFRSNQIHFGSNWIFYLKQRYTYILHRKMISYEVKFQGKIYMYFDKSCSKKIFTQLISSTNIFLLIYYFFASILKFIFSWYFWIWIFRTEQVLFYKKKIQFLFKEHVWQIAAYQEYKIENLVSSKEVYPCQRTSNFREEHPGCRQRETDSINKPHFKFENPFHPLKD